MARLRAQEGPASGQPAPAPPAGDAGDRKKAKKKPAGAGAPRHWDKSSCQALTYAQVTPVEMSCNGTLVK